MGQMCMRETETERQILNAKFSKISVNLVGLSVKNVPLVNSPPKLIFKEFCISHSRGGGVITHQVTPCRCF